MEGNTIRTDLKIIVIGPSGSGKTSFVNRWTKNQFTELHKATIVSEFGFKIYEYKGNLYRVQLWDIGGQDKSPTIANIFSRDSHGCLVLCDCVNRSTIDDSLSWKSMVEEQSQFMDGSKLPFVLVENKIDTVQGEEEKKQVERDLKLVADSNNFCGSFVTSAKEDIGINDAMKFLVETIIEKLEDCAKKGKDFFSDKSRNESVNLDKSKHSSIKPKSKKGRCCSSSDK